MIGIAVSGLLGRFGVRQRVWKSNIGISRDEFVRQAGAEYVGQVNRQRFGVVVALYRGRERYSRGSRRAAPQ